MRRIKVDAVLKAKSDAFCRGLFSKKDASFISPITKLEKLRDNIPPRKHKAYRAYVQGIIDSYPQIVAATPDEIDSLIISFNNILPYNKVKQNVPYKKSTFWEAVVDAMRYEDLRSTEFPVFLKSEQFKACIYCNAQLSVVVDFTYYSKKKKKVHEHVARLELDHYFPKSDYPFLCTSFYNLYPVCSNCNRSKSIKHAKFRLYTETNDLEVFRFWLDEDSVVKYWVSGKHEDLKVYFDHIDGDIDFLKNHNELFKIQGVYDTQTDVAEELVNKAKAYSNAYKNGLVNSLKSIFPDTALINRLLVGNYTAPEDVHKRPLAKFTQDIARQLKLI